MQSYPVDSTNIVWQECGWLVKKGKKSDVTAYDTRLPGNIYGRIEKSGDGKWFATYPYKTCDGRPFDNIEDAKKESQRVMLALAQRAIEMLKAAV